MDIKIAGGVLLIVGTSIGAGMLALPIVSAESGFLASTVMLLLCWVVMTFAAFLILEVNLWFPPRSNIITMARHTLGKPAEILAWFIYLFLLYSLLAAYIAGGSDLFHGLAVSVGLPISPKLMTFIFLGAFGFIVCRGIKPVDYVNRVLMITKLGTLSALILFAVPHVNIAELKEGHPFLVFTITTVMITSFGFSNIIPSLRSYFDSDVRKLRTAILIGSLIPLGCYILWDFAILGVMPHGGQNSLLNILHHGGSVSQLTESLSAILNNSSITAIVHVFTAICVCTSFLCVALSLTDFLADGMKIEKKGAKQWIIYFCTFVPPLITVLFYPQIFVKALSYAGMFCIILLMVMPALMVWNGRYRKAIAAPHHYRVVGGKIAIIALIIASLAIIFLAKGW